MILKMKSDLVFKQKTDQIWIVLIASQKNGQQKIVTHPELS